MSGFDNAALPGRIPTSHLGKDLITPESLFKDSAEKAMYRRFMMDAGEAMRKEFKVKKVKVRIFDLSDAKQCREYEKLWAELLMKVSKMEAVVESSKDLVHRPDGTSYWMKYVEYVEFDDGSTEDRKAAK